MITVSYIVFKIIIISLVYLRVLLQCSRFTRRSANSITSSKLSHFEEDTKLEEKFERPAWDKEFPKILPPPVHVPEKENKEVDVEPDFMIMSAPRLDKCLGIESETHRERESGKPDRIEQIFDDNTQKGSAEKATGEPEHRASKSKNLLVHEEHQHDIDGSKQNKTGRDLMKLNIRKDEKNSPHKEHDLIGAKRTAGSSTPSLLSDTAPASYIKKSVFGKIKRESKEKPLRSTGKVRISKTDRSTSSAEKVRKKKM